ncbi:MAG: polyprenyl diphosphate synthase, partial [Chthoniobacterales bacterium]
PRIEGHRRGSQSVRACTAACVEAGVPYLTLYAFSKENWQRPADEVTALTLTLALSYGARTEIVDAARRIAREVKAGSLDPETVDEDTINSHLYTAGIPDPDLLVRTSGEMRISNFLLWQISYAEIVVTPKLWPDFAKEDLFAAMQEYARRNRRYGGI